MRNISRYQEHTIDDILTSWKALTIKVKVHVDKNDLFQFGESFCIKRRDVEEVLVVPATKETTAQQNSAKMRQAENDPLAFW